MPFPQPTEFSQKWARSNYSLLVRMANQPIGKKKKKKRDNMPNTLLRAAAAAAAKLLQLCPTLCDPIDSSPPGSPVPGILQAKTLKWVAISFSNTWKWKVKVKSLSRVRLLGTPWTAAYQAPPSMGPSRQEFWSGLPLPSPASVYFLTKSSLRISEAGTVTLSNLQRWKMTLNLIPELVLLTPRWHSYSILFNK